MAKKRKNESRQAQLAASQGNLDEVDSGVDTESEENDSSEGEEAAEVQDATPATKVNHLVFYAPTNAQSCF